jgi:cyanophycinase-like exopeptidase
MGPGKEGRGDLYGGGDPWNSVGLWKDRRFRAAIAERIRARAPVGGTSAGLFMVGLISRGV